MKLKSGKKEIGSEKLTNIITHEEIISIRSIPSYPKKFNEIIKLAVNIPTNSDGALDRLNVPFLNQNGPSLITKSLNLSLGKRLTLHQMLDLTVQIRVRGHDGGVKEELRSVIRDRRLRREWGGSRRKGSLHAAGEKGGEGENPWL